MYIFLITITTHHFFVFFDSAKCFVVPTLEHDGRFIKVRNLAETWQRGYRGENLTSTDRPPAETAW